MSDLQELARQLKDITTNNKLTESTMVISESQDFIYAHRDELVKQYPDQWIAVYRKDIVGHHKDLLSLVRKLRASGVPLQHVALEMLSREQTPLALQLIA